MAIDASIYAQYAPRPKSVGDYLADMDAEDSRRQTLQQNKLTLLMNQNKLDDDNRTRAEMGQVRNALLRLSPTATEAQRLEALRGTGTLTGYNQADALAKSLAAQRKAQLENDKLKFELAKGNYDIYSRTLGTLAQDPTLTKDKAIGAARLLVQQGVLSPEMFEAGTATLSDDPAQLRLQLQQGLAAQATPEQILTLFSAKPTVVDGRVVDFNPRSQGYGKTIVERQANPAQDLVIPGPDGQMMPNQPLIGARKQVAAAGATKVDVNTGDNSFAKKAAEIQAAEFGKAFEQGQAANRTLAQIGRLEALLAKTGGGFTPAIKAYAGQFGVSTSGLDDIQAAEALIQSLIPQQRPPGTGAMSDRDVEMFRQSLPRLINQPGGNQKILRAMRGIAEYDRKMGQIASDALNGKITRDQAAQQMSTLANPLSEFSGEEGQSKNTQQDLQAAA